MVFFDWDTLDNTQIAPTPTQQRNPAIGVINQLRAAVCAASRAIPDSLYGGFVDNPVRDFNRATRNLICPLDPEQPETNAFSGGQCVGTQYSVTRTERYYRTSTDAFRTASVTTTLTGAIGRPFKVNSGGFSGFYIPTGAGDIQFSALSNNAADEQIFDVRIDSIVPLGGASDNCGDVVNDRPNPGGTTNVFNYNFTVGGTTLNIPITISPIRIDGSIDVNAVFSPTLNFTANFNLGGVDLTVNFPGGTQPTNNQGNEVNLQPLLDAVADVQEDVDSVSAKTDEVSAKVLDIHSRIGEPSAITILDPDDLCSTSEVTPTNLFNAFDVLADNSNRYYRKDCEGEDFNFVNLGSYLTSVEQRSFYVDCPSNTVIVFLTLNEPLPPKVGYTLSNEISGSFGAVSLCSEGTTAIYQTEQIYTLNTQVNAPPTGTIPRVRVFLKPDISFTLLALVKVVD